MVIDRALFLEWVQQHRTFAEILTDAVRQAFPNLTTYTKEDGEASLRLMRLKGLKFHAHSSFREKIAAIIFMEREYIVLRDQVFRSGLE